MDVKRLDVTSTWKSQEEIESALSAQPEHLLAGLEWSDAEVCTTVLAFKYTDHWRLLYASELSFATQTQYYEMVDVVNALSRYVEESGTELLIHTSPYASFVDKEPEQVLAAMQDECYMAFNKRNFMKLLSHYEHFKNPVDEYPITVDALVCRE